ncbi:CinA family nicotinamide mononucleotide deamidase-related protein [Niabella beijingensis]|uniref:CinA family nicotinamide mononucleotide deamidase-related protein n=1 Tax=Niabella beijingensis TaxID=2872700 RepID=UPI001CC00C81|nr:CinA family nicotinamide mononucleotide deamidase-related protein [Niabella beijingensis]MBZ4190708.1 CinA family nicotinamide mononucleotide deamidase-related protein [Niabella beijingensis]
MNASIITIGDELLIGQTIDTNSAFIAQEFNKLGIWVKRRVAVGDVAADIEAALDEESRQSQLVILTGGLGPTADDITKPLLNNYFGGKMVVDPNVALHIEYLFKKVYNRPSPIAERNRKQAEVPDVAKVLHNARGSAPGMWFEKNTGGKNVIFVSLPGVPYEMKGLLTEEVIPRLLKHFKFPFIVHRTAFTAGMGESMVAERLLDFEAALPRNISLAYLPSFGMVKLRLTGQGHKEQQLTDTINLLFGQMTALLEDIVVSKEDEPIEKVIGRLLTQQQKTVATAESCTGGNVAHWITRIPGSSDYFKGSIVAYSNHIKEQLLAVSPETLRLQGAVSSETVEAMVKGALQQLDTDYAVATSGIAGPGGGSALKPVGTIWIAAGNRDKIVTKLLQLRFDREQNIEVTTMQALLLLRRVMLGLEDNRL